MMKYFLISIAFMVMFSCEKEGISIKKDDYLIFGHFYGFCQGDQCVQTYKLTNNTLYKDFRERFKDSIPDFRPIDDDKFELVKDLSAKLPRKLLNSDQERFGCPDCADQGGILIEVSKRGKVDNWVIDQRKVDVPEYLHDFVDAVNQAIADINK